MEEADAALRVDDTDDEAMEALDDCSDIEETPDESKEPSLAPFTDSNELEDVTLFIWLVLLGDMNEAASS